MKVIRHQKHQIKIPDAALIVRSRGFEDLLRGRCAAELILPFCAAAECNEIRCAKASGEVDAMIERLPNEPFHAGGTSEWRLRSVAATYQPSPLPDNIRTVSPEISLFDRDLN